MCNDWEVVKTTLALPYPYPDGAAEQWISTHAERFRQGTELVLAITLKPDGLVVGSMSLMLRAVHQRAEFGYMVARERWNHGYCTEAARAIMRYGFEQLELNRIEATHFVRNPASGRVMQKLGMVREGLLRQHVRNRGTFEDLVMHSMLRSDFEQA
jgi:RimJ/RimL family protein N-acetyltransferase